MLIFTQGMLELVCEFVCELTVGQLSYFIVLVLGWIKCFWGSQRSIAKIRRHFRFSWSRSCIGKSLRQKWAKLSRENVIKWEMVNQITSRKTRLKTIIKLSVHKLRTKLNFSVTACACDWTLWSLRWNKTLRIMMGSGNESLLLIPGFCWNVDFIRG